MLVLALAAAEGVHEGRIDPVLFCLRLGAALAVRGICEDTGRSGGGARVMATD